MHSETILPAGTPVVLLAHVTFGETQLRTRASDGAPFTVCKAKVIVCDGMPAPIVVAVLPEKKRPAEDDHLLVYPPTCRITPGIRFDLDLPKGSNPSALVGQVVVISATLEVGAWFKKGVCQHAYRGRCTAPPTPLCKLGGKEPLTLPVSEFAAPTSASRLLAAGTDEDDLQVHGALLNVDITEATFGDDKQPRLGFTGTMNGVPVRAHGWSFSQSLGLGDGKTNPDCGDAWARFLNVYLGLAQPVCAARVDGEATALETIGNTGRIVVDNARFALPTAANLARIGLRISDAAAKAVVDKMPATTLPAGSVADSVVVVLPGKHASTRMSILAAAETGASFWYVPGFTRVPANPARVAAALEAAGKAADDAKRIDALNAALGAEVVAEAAMLIVLREPTADVQAEINKAWQRLAAATQRKRPRDEPAAPAAPAAKVAAVAPAKNEAA